MSKELLKQAHQALELMKEEFRGYDLPYGSKAYAKANEVSHAIFAALSAPQAEPVAEVRAKTNAYGGTFVQWYSLPVAGMKLYAAPQPSPAVPRKMDIPPPQVDALEVVYAEGWNAACDAFFGGLPPKPALVVEVSAAPVVREPLSDEQIGRISYFCADARGPRVDQFKFARDIERAHGIGGSNG